MNHSDITAMDILIQRRRDARDLEMEESLKQAGANESNINSFSLRIKEKPDRHRSRRNTNKKRNNNQNDWLDKKRSALMVVASLIATMAFEVGVHPPDKIWDESPTSNSTQPFHIRNPLYYVRKAGEFLKKGERFYIINTVSFIASLTIILLLMSGLPLNSRFFVWVLLLITWIAISVIALSYTVAVVLIAPSSKEKEIYAMVGVTVFVWICVMALLVLGHTLRLFVMVLKMLLKMLKLLIRPLFPRRRNSAAYTPNNARV